MAEAHHDLGLCYDQHGDVTRAIQELEEAIRVAPQWTSYALHLGGLYVKTGEWDRAIKLTDHLWDQDGRVALELAMGIVAARTMPIAPSDKNALSVEEHLSSESRALVLSAQQAPTFAAIKLLQEAVRHDPQEPLLWYWLATAYNEAGDSISVIHTLESGLSVHPKHPMLLLTLGWAYYTRQRYDEARAAWERIKSIDEVAYQTCAKLVGEIEGGVFRTFGSTQ